MKLSKSLALAAAFAVATLTQSVSAQCIGGGVGGPIPATGTGTTSWPSPLPVAPLVSTLAVTVPPGATVLKSVKLIGATHTWSGDVQFVLQNPAGGLHNLLCGMPLDPGADFNGNYELVDQLQVVAGLAPAWSYAGAVVPSGTYGQDFGGHANGQNGINNTPIEQIPISNGNWTLYAYDWFAADQGALTSWELCFGTPTPPTAPTSAPTLLTPADTAFLPLPIDFTWSTVLGATSYDLDIDGTITTGITTQPYNVTSLPAGGHTWTVRAVNGAGAGPWAAAQTFSTPTPPPPTTCLAGAAVGLAFPATGAVNGVWPTVLPTGGISSSATIAPPSGSTLFGVKLIGLQHSWSTDMMIVLQDPAGTNHLIWQRDNGSNCGGCGDDFNGDYIFTSDASAVSIPTCGVTVIPQGSYQGEFGIWNSGDAGIVNTTISAIPLSSGTWTLKIYDWCTTFDDGFLGSWELCFAAPAGPVSYCTAGTTTNGCTADISASANPSVAGATPCAINVSDVEGNKSGLIFYSISGQTAANWNATSFLCVKAPTQRTPTQTSTGATGTCNGTLTLDWNAYQAANPGAVGNPWSAGDTVQLQAWFRDPPAGKSTNLSNAIEMTYVP